MTFEFSNLILERKKAERGLDERFGIILRNLGLSVEDLKNKKILDIGAGERSIAAYCLKNGISNDVYSVEPNLNNPLFVKDFIGKNWPELRKKIDKKTVVGKRNQLSFKDDSFDLIINHAAMPGFGNALREGNAEKIKKGLDKIFNELLRVLKPGGEARIYPVEISSVFESEKERELFGLRDEEVLKKLNELSEEGYLVKIEEVEKNDPNRINLHRAIIKSPF